MVRNQRKDHPFLAYSNLILFNLIQSFDLNKKSRFNEIFLYLISLINNVLTLINNYTYSFR